MEKADKHRMFLTVSRGSYVKDCPLWNRITTNTDATGGTWYAYKASFNPSSCRNHVLVRSHRIAKANHFDDDVMPVEYKDDGGSNHSVLVVGTVYTPGDGDYCSHKTRINRELSHEHVSNYLANGFTDPATQVWVTAARVKAFYDTVYQSGDGWTFVEAATTKGCCHSYAMTDVDLAYWLNSAMDASNRMLKDNYVEISLPEDHAVACDDSDWGEHPDNGDNEVIGHTWYVEDVFRDSCGQVTGVRTRSEKSNSSPVYKKIYNTPLMANWQFFRKIS